MTFGVIEINNTVRGIVGLATAISAFHDDAQRKAIASDKTLNRKARRKKLAELRRKKR